MRWFLVLAALVSVWFLVLPHAFAQTEPNTQTLSPQQQERVINLAANMTNRMEAMVKRMQQINGRIQSRAEQVNDQPEAMERVMKGVSAINSLLNEANRFLASIDSDIHAVATAEAPGKQWQSVRAQYLDIKQKLRKAHNEMSLIGSILHNPNSFTPAQNSNATSTASSSLPIELPATSTATTTQ